MARPTDYPIVWGKNLPYRTSVESLYELFGQFGNINQIRIPEKGSSRDILGTCLVVYNNLDHARAAAAGLNGVNYEGRYLVTSLYNVDPTLLEQETFEARTSALHDLKANHGIQ